MSVNRCCSVSLLCAVVALSVGASGMASPAGEWIQSEAPDEPSPRKGAGIAAIDEGKVLLFGDRGSEGALGDTWIYDRGSDTWTLMEPEVSPSARDVPGLASLEGDRVLLYGGARGGRGLVETWIYDLSDNEWTLMEPFATPEARYGCFIASLGGDRVLMFGGRTDTDYVEDTWVYDLAINMWMQVTAGGGPSGRQQHAMCSIGVGKVLVFGGTDRSAGTWGYDDASLTWTDMNPAVSVSTRIDARMTDLRGDRALYYGGAYPPMITETWIYDLGDNVWTKLELSAGPGERKQQAMGTLGEGQVILFGGIDVAGTLQSGTWLFSQSADQE